MVKTGRYGPYVSHDGVNATLPSDKTPETVTLEEAVSLLDARATRRPAADRSAAARRPRHRRQDQGQIAARQAGPARRAASAGQEARPQGQEGRAE